MAVRERPRLLYLVAADWFFWSHRLPIARAARDHGFEVIVATHVDRHGDLIRQEGFVLRPIRLCRGWRSVGYEAGAFLEVLRLYRAERPDLVHHVALKPILYGSLAARLARVPAVVNALAGLGYVFSSESWKARALRPLIRFGLRVLLGGPNQRVIVQNPDDRDFLARAGYVQKDRIVLIRGSGVDTDLFVATPEPSGRLVVTMVSRMLWNKGVGILVEAVRRLREEGHLLRLLLVGPLDPENPDSVPEEQLRAWSASGSAEWLGQQDDVASLWARSHVAVLPTYYGEGLPKALLEAAACARPIVATDMPGCREIVRDGENGFLVPPQDTLALAAAIGRLLGDSALRQRMGLRGRQIVEREFDEKRVVTETLTVYRALAAQ